ncbi:MAG: TrkA family potassium uptake protein [Pseudomonadota bacterium]
MSHKPKTIAVIGLGTFGLSVARTLSKMGDTVLGIDTQETGVADVCDDIASAVQADATDPKALIECGLENYDTVLVSIGKDLEANILAAMNAKELGCKNVWVKAQTETQRKVLEAIGVDRVVLPEIDYGASVAELIHNPTLKDAVRIDGYLYLTVLRVESSVMKNVEQKASTFSDFELQCVGTYNNGEIKPLSASENDAKTQTLILLGTRTAIRNFADTFDR